MEKIQKTEYVTRVNQLDSIQLDTDITRIMREQLVKSLQNLSPGFLSQYQPELDLLIRSTIWKLSVHLNSATFGQQLLFTCYDKDKFTNNKMIFHYILNVLVKYLKDIATLRMTRNQKIQKCITWTDNVITIFDLVNFFRFIKCGKKPGITDYLLGLNFISMYGNKRRDIGYSYMTRELIWDGFMELLGFTLPLINYHSIKRKLRKVFIKSRKNQGIEDDQMNILHKHKFKVTTKCIYCNERPTLPHHMGCQHIFCYYCLQANLMADENFQCSICDWNGKEIIAI